MREDITHITAFFKEGEVETKDKLLDSFLRECEERALLPILFEWEMLIRSVLLFPVINFHMLSEEVKSSLIRKNFLPELRALEDAVRRAALLSIRLENRNTEFYSEFEDFIEEYFMRKYGVMTLELPKRGKGNYWGMVSQVTELFLDWRHVLSRVKEAPEIPYIVFFSTTRRIVRELKRIPLMDTYLKKRFKRPLDRVAVPEIKETIASIKERTERRRVALVFLMISKLIKYLDYLENLLRQAQIPMRFYPILILIKYDFALLIKVLQTNRKTLPKLKPLMEKLLQSLEGEYKKVFFGELLNISFLSLPSAMKEKLGRSVFLLKSLLKDMVVELVGFYRRGVEKKTLFPSHIGRKEQTKMLLKNLDAALFQLDFLLSKGKVERFEAEELISDLEKKVIHLLLYKDWEALEKAFADIRRATTTRDIFLKLSNLKNILLYIREEVKKREFSKEPSEEKAPGEGR